MPRQAPKLECSAEDKAELIAISKSRVEEARNRDRGEPHDSAPPTPPDMRVRIRRFGELSQERTVNLGIPSEAK